MSILAYNNPEVSGCSTWDFNCGGFALGDFSWYYPSSWNDAKYNPNTTMQEKLKMATEDILNDYPYLIPISSPRNIPKRFKVIGFRFAEYDGEYDCWDFNDNKCEGCTEFVDEGYEENYCDNCHREQVLKDFHFIARYKGVWYHKRGGCPIEKYVGDINKNWSDYDSDIVWFIDPTNRLDT